jgi:hypothetical protein
VEKVEQLIGLRESPRDRCPRPAALACCGRDHRGAAFRRIWTPPPSRDGCNPPAPRRQHGDRCRHRPRRSSNPEPPALPSTPQLSVATALSAARSEPAWSTAATKKLRRLDDYLELGDPSRSIHSTACCYRPETAGPIAVDQRHTDRHYRLCERGGRCQTQAPPAWVSPGLLLGEVSASCVLVPLGSNRGSGGGMGARGKILWHC